MPKLLKRREVLRGAGFAIGAACAGSAWGSRARAAGANLILPTVDQLRVRVVLDTAHDVFISGDPHPMVGIERTRVLLNPKRVTLGGEWGLSLHLESSNGAAAHRYLLDFG